MKWKWLVCQAHALIAAAEFVNQVREYHLELGSKWMGLDGNFRPSLTVNGTTPGPLIWGYEGDTLRVHVTNKLLVETTMHWHGVFQYDKYWMDGVPGVTQYPIEPRGSYTYEFTLTNQTGIYFYHGHFGPAFADGQRGPLWIKPAPWRERPYSLISDKKEDIAAMLSAEDKANHLLVSDWFLQSQDLNIISYRDSGASPTCVGSLVMNGRGRTICLDRATIDQSDNGLNRDSMGCLPPDVGSEYLNKRECASTTSDLEVVQAEEGERYAWLNFIHPGAHHELRISVDEHDMWIVAADGDFVKPKKVQAININMGERISVLVPLTQRPANYAIRMASLAEEQLIWGLGILRYPSAADERSSAGVMSIPRSTPHIDIAGAMLTPGGVLMDEMRDLAPWPARRPPTYTNRTLRFAIQRPGPSTWVLASEPHQGFRQQMPPVLWNAGSRGPTTVEGLRNGSVVDIVYENGAFGMHPFHKHNHKAFIIGMGDGFFRWPDVEAAIRDVPENFNLVDPPLRDGARLAKGEGSWTVIRYQITFPAMSMLHCRFSARERAGVRANEVAGHRIHHFAGGQQIVLLEGAEAMPPLPEYIKNMTHADFVPPLRYGPLD
ncbi:putative multicopper oxidase [Neofusicoccum parvum]|uniref:Multicopper oxidase n=1 Tax=Neofusicoccum parvum TaxID=310453 RepID=A0ACB5SK54_9PEZI|nr:putative multicopper oxidase [Neofusicoccum parvum]